MKKIINTADAVIEDYITGVVGAAPHLARVEGWPVIVRADAQDGRTDRVALVTGGGSGHEPAHAGFVGRGMLDAAVLGPVFTSPSVDAVFAAIRTVATPAGVVLIVKNYTGDRLNFGLAAEMARAEGIRVEMIVVADDAALGDSSRAGRRGLTATVLAHKVAGACAARGDSIEQVVATVERLLGGAATMGVALGACTVPGAERANFALAEDEVEWGLGIHGEAGSERGTLVPSAQIAERLVDAVVTDRGLAAGDEVAVLVNGLGGTPDLELRILHGDVLRAVAARGLVTRMTWAAPLLTSLEMPGASVTIAAVDDELLELLGAEVDVLAFPHRTAVQDPACVRVVPAPHAFQVAAPEGAAPNEATQALRSIVRAVADELVRAEQELTDLDRQVGDGDLGINLARGARAVLAADGVLAVQADAAQVLIAVSDILRREVGGTSGPLYSLFLLAMAETVAAGADWADAAAAGLARVQAIGGAAPGDSTMVDALHPGVGALREGVAAAAAAAMTGATETARLRPALGRSSYVGDRAVGIPDPGAIAVALQFAAIRTALGGDV